ncbi:MAG: septum formation initiator family protein [Elusimicrobiales bacterium]|nr:septum formation initiator family protein [Elusimicrobiales bacterium]
MKPLRFRLNLKYLLLAVVAAALLGNSGFRSLVKNYREYRRLGAEKARLEAQHRDLQRQRREVSAKPAIEQAARKELSMLRPGETEYRFPAPKESDK